MTSPLSNVAYRAGCGKCGARYHSLAAGDALAFCEPGGLASAGTSTPDELAQFIPAEIRKWARVVKDAGIEPE
jgi:hypothetical protein